MRYPMQLLRFIGNLDVDPEGKLDVYGLEERPTISPYTYYPKTNVSLLAQEVLNRIRLGTIKGSPSEVNHDSVVYLAEKLKLENFDFYTYHLTRLVMLEAFSISYAIHEDRTLLKLISDKTMLDTFNNAKYILEVVSGEDSFNPLVIELHDLIVSLGYLKAQAPVLREGRIDDGQL